MKDAEFVFDEKCMEAFELLKNALITAPIMQPPDWSKTFEIMCDTSDYVVGAFLGEKTEKIFMRSIMQVEPCTKHK